MDCILESTEITNQNTIRNVIVHYREGGSSAEIQWDWPQDLEYTNCFIYLVTEGELKECSLSEIIEKGNPEIRDRRAPKGFTTKIDRAGKICIIIPGRYDRINKCYTLLPQEAGNKTPVMKVRPEIRIDLTLKDINRGFFRKVEEQEAVFSVKVNEQPMPGSILTYRCAGGTRSQVRYGIDLCEFWKEAMKIVIAKNEHLIFEDPEDGSFTIRR